MRVSDKTRWLAGVTSLATILAGSLGGGLTFVLAPLPLICGALIVRRRPRVGEALLAAGAVYLSLLTIPFGIALLLAKGAWAVASTVSFAVLAVLLLVAACDIALVFGALKRRSSSAAEDTWPASGMVVGQKTRWLAGATGLVTIAAGSLLYGSTFLEHPLVWVSVVFPSPLICGAIVVGRWPRAGEALLSAGAMIMSLWTVPYCMVFLLAKGDWTPRVSFAAFVVVLLVLACDVTLVKQSR